MMQSIKRRLVATSATLLSTGLLLGALSHSPAGADSEKKNVPGLPVLAAVDIHGWQPTPKRTGPISGVPVKNFGVVAPGILYRSGQPSEKGFKWLAEQGFRSVVSLRKEYDDGAERLKGYGLNYLYLPITDHRIPTDDQVRQFLAFVRDPKNWPVLVHCEGGRGRAGIMAAVARYSIESWDMSDALREGRSYRPLNFRFYGEQRRYLNRWKDRFEPGAYHPSKPIPAWPPTTSTTRTAQN